MDDRGSVVSDPDSSSASISIIPNLETVVLSHVDDSSKTSRDQSSFFHSVEDGNLHLLQILLKNRTIDVNGYNDQGMTALHIAIYKYETRQQLDIVETLLKHGADPCMKAATPPQASKISIVRPDSSHPDVLLETKKISLDQKTPLLIALELKSTLYLRGWEYRHWDAMLKLLSEATSKALSEKGVHENASVDKFPDDIKQGWNTVFQTGNHDLVQVCAEGKEMTALKMLLRESSKKLKMNLESIAACHSKSLELKDISFNIAKAMVKFIYTGAVDEEIMEQRGIDLFVAAHKYGVVSLKALCEAEIKPTQDNWIKLLTAAIESDSDILAFKCARSIEDVMEKRWDGKNIFKKSFSGIGNDAPNQLFHVQH